MDINKTIGIVGKGYGLPANIRTNDDPVFDWLKEHNPSGTDLFQGYKYRRVLSADENVMDILVPAALKALSDANMSASDIDCLLGYVSVGEFNTPNTLIRLHQELNMGAYCSVIPIQADFNNFNYALLFADSLIRTGRAKNVMIATASNWTKYVDYHTPASLSVSDGAGVVVLSATEKRGCFSFADISSVMDSSLYGTMFVQPDLLTYAENKPLFSRPYFHLTDAGQIGFNTFGKEAPPLAVKKLLEKNQISSDEICLISHQSSSVLMEFWQNAAQPKQYINTLEIFANMELAVLPVNFAFCYDEIKTEYVVLLGIGMDFQTSAVLLKRN
jgi:3-oxoacyl-[acyl-carrier-protein] synthase-3